MGLVHITSRQHSTSGTVYSNLIVTRGFSSRSFPLPMLHVPSQNENPADEPENASRQSAASVCFFYAESRAPSYAHIPHPSLTDVASDLVYKARPPHPYASKTPYQKMSAPLLVLTRACVGKSDYHFLFPLKSLSRCCM
jgi:hypothetical protein